MTTVWFSLRRRLLTLLLGGVAAAWMGTILFSYVDARHEVDELFDAQLAQAAQALLALGEGAQGGLVRSMGEAGHKYQRRLRFQLWSADGRLLMRSQGAPEQALTPTAGFSEKRDAADGRRWRHFSQWNAEHTLQIQVAEDLRIRGELVLNIARRLLFPLLLGLPFIGLWVWVAIREGLSSLDGVAREISQRRPDQLQALVTPSAPAEIRPLLDELNGLFQRVEQTLENERRFTADAAHELRTPLAALLAHLQVALRARDAAERDQSLQSLQQGLQRATHLVDQMLQLARLDPESGLPDAEPTSLALVAEAVCADLGPAILTRDIEFDFAAEGDCRIVGKAEWLRVLVRNLVDNALRYTPAGGRIRVVVKATGGGVRLQVEDSGPGIPVSQRAVVLRRFHRLDNSGQPGSGLGLAIVVRIAELHGARLELGDSSFGSGLSASVLFATDEAAPPVR